MKADLVRLGYDSIASEYLKHRSMLGSSKYVSRLIKLLKKNATVLDLGCGAGVGVDDILIKSGHAVIGLDNSPQQIKLAKLNCKKGEYIVCDISTLSDGEFSVDAIVSFYTLFHLPREKHQTILRTWSSFLRPGGLLLLTMGDRAFEGEHLMYGRTMWSSQFGTVKNEFMVEQAGFTILVDEIDTSGGERHQVILGQKR